MRGPNTSGTIEVGLPLLIVAVLGLVVLPAAWPRLPPLLACGLATLVAGFGIGGALLLGRPGGMGANARLDDPGQDDPQ